MPVELTRLLAAVTLLGLVLAMQPAAALHPARNHHNDRGIARSWAAAPRPPVYYDDTPSYDDPSKFGGGSVPENPPSPVHVQPRGSGFDPNSGAAQAVQKRTTDFNEMQKIHEQSFDRKLLICRGC
jgi:hypothetical protein